MAYRITFVEPIHCGKCNRDLPAGAVARITDATTVEHDCAADAPRSTVAILHLAVVRVDVE